MVPLKLRRKPLKKLIHGDGSTINMVSRGGSGDPASQLKLLNEVR